METTSYFEEMTGFRFWDAGSWSPQQAVVFVVGVACAFEFLGRVVPLLFGHAGKIEARGKHHDVLDWKDLVGNKNVSQPMRPIHAHALSSYRSEKHACIVAVLESFFVICYEKSAQ